MLNYGHQETFPLWLHSTAVNGNGVSQTTGYYSEQQASVSASVPSMKKEAKKKVCLFIYFVIIISLA